MVIIEKENFSVSQICSSGQCFRLDPADETGKVYELTAGDRYLKIEVAEDQKKVRFYCTQEEFEQFWKTYFDLDTCYADYLSLIKDDFAAGFMGNDRNIYFIPAEQYTEDQIDDTKNQ